MAGSGHTTDRILQQHRTAFGHSAEGGLNVRKAWPKALKEGLNSLQVKTWPEPVLSQKGKGTTPRSMDCQQQLGEGEALKNKQGGKHIQD